MQDTMPDQYAILNELNARLRILEGKYGLMRERLFIINENMIEHYKKLSSEMDSLKTDVKEIKDTLFSLKGATRSIVKELDFFAVAFNCDNLSLVILSFFCCIFLSLIKK